MASLVQPPIVRAAHTHAQSAPISMRLAAAGRWGPEKAAGLASKVGRGGLACASRPARQIRLRLPSSQYRYWPSVAIAPPRKVNSSAIASGVTGGLSAAEVRRRCVIVYSSGSGGRGGEAVRAYMFRDEGLQQFVRAIELAARRDRQGNALRRRPQRDLHDKGSRHKART